MKNFEVKKTSDGRALLNVACGAKTHSEWNNVDFSPYTRLRQHPALSRGLRKLGLISDLRWGRLQALDPDIRSWNLKKGIPWPDQSFDAVYHSHFLEHIPRESAPELLGECLRVLKPGGILRVSVPDLHHYIRLYTKSFEALSRGDEEALSQHEQAVAGMYDQFVRREATGLKEQTNPVVRLIERIVRPTPEKTGERHQWMYDEHTLVRLLCETGFSRPQVMRFDTSRIPDWNTYGLDRNESGGEYKPESLYVEAEKPGQNS